MSGAEEENEGKGPFTERRAATEEEFGGRPGQCGTRCHAADLYTARHLRRTEEFRRRRVCFCIAKTGKQRWLMGDSLAGTTRLLLSQYVGPAGRSR
jgi:hypothetical protein